MPADKFKNRYRIPSARAPWHGYDGGVYFVTICTKNREHYFGEIVHNCRDAKFCVSTKTNEPTMQLSEIGNVADDCMKQIPTHFPHVDVPLYVVMPNHIHAVIIINPLVVETQNFASLQGSNKFGPQSKNLASVVRGFKIGVTKYTRQHNLAFEWQTRFHDHIIRNQEECNRIADYIENNVAKWDSDMNNISNL